jgi:hypothetical protein
MGPGSIRARAKQHLSNLVGQGRQCASFDCCGSGDRRVSHVSGPECSTFGGEDFQTNLIMPEPCPFISRKLPPCSIIRPTETKGIAKGVVKFLTDMGLFIGQSPAFFPLMQNLAEDAARHGS